jgi:hypothetical protein
VVCLDLLQRLQQVLRRFVGHTIQIGQRRQAQAVKIGQSVDDAAVDQLIHQFVAQALDLDRATLRKVQYGLLALRAAKQPTGAAVVCLALLAYGGAATDRAVCWAWRKTHASCRIVPLSASADPVDFR